MNKEQRAQLNYLRMAPRKVRAVADLIKDLSVNEAETQLLFEKRRAAKPLLKLLRSAVASSLERRMNIDLLRIASLRVDQGPIVKRIMPRARGVASPIQKKTSHVILVLVEDSKTKPSRYKIVVKKKVKIPKEERAKEKKEKTDKKDFIDDRREREKKDSKPGFLKRMFRRKAGM